MKNSAVKRMIAVLLCLVVFAGSELTGLTNIVGSLAAMMNRQRRWTCRRRKNPQNRKHLNRRRRRPKLPRRKRKRLHLRNPEMPELQLDSRKKDQRAGCPQKKEPIQSKRQMR